MDGNGRWAQQREMDRTEGHRHGARSVEASLRAARRHGIKYLTLFAFSSENWNRPREEVNFLMNMLLAYLREQVELLLENEIRFETIGDLSVLPDELQAEISRAKLLTAHYEDHQINLAINYGSRNELLEAAKRFARDVASGRADPDALDWPQFTSYFYTAGIPDPDLIIRTSGEWRLSNFLLAQSAYSEFYFSNVLWPDFDEADFYAAIAHFAQRERRFGKTSEQVSPQQPLTAPPV